MTIAYIVPSLTNKGPVIVVNTIVNHIIKHVDCVDVFYFDDELNLNFPCSTYKIAMGTPMDFDKYDIVHSHGYRPDRYIYKWRKKIKKAKTVSTIHADIAQDLKFSYNKFVSLFFTPLWLFYIKYQFVVTVISDKLLRIYAGKFKNIHRVYNGIDIDLNLGNLEIEIVDPINNLKRKGFKIIGTYAFLTRRKGLDQLVSVLQFRKDLAIVIIGEGYAKKELEEQARKLGVIDRVLFFPYIKTPYNYIHLFDVYSMTSRSEGFGLALVEAALTKAAIICSDIEVFHEIFNETQVSFYKLDDIESLSVAIDTSIITKEDKGILAYKHACEVFSGESMAENYLELYKTLIV
jgi:glycosyltransferase involved in cell wall biosynthesis